MANIVHGADVVEAWQGGGELLSQAPTHAIQNLITEIAVPTVVDPDWYSRFCPKSVGAQDRLSVVAKVLFPDIPRKPGETRIDFYARCESLLRRALRIGSLHSAWGGTYFQRLLSLNKSENQIERAIRILSEWEIRSETAIVMHTSSPAIDGLRKRGSPCLQYLEILWRQDGTLDLVAVYRNHDFLNKALGNFIGLGRLLNFIATEGGKVPGRVICHSVHAYVAQITAFRTLLAK
jgi:thymidylate synthase